MWQQCIRTLRKLHVFKQINNNDIALYTCYRFQNWPFIHHFFSHAIIDILFKTISIVILIVLNYWSIAHSVFFFCLTTNTTCNVIIIEYVLMIRRCRNSFLVYLEIAMDNSRRRQTGGCTRAPHNSCPHGSSPPETSNNSPSIRNSLKIVHRYHQLSSSFIIRAVYLFFSTKKNQKKQLNSIAQDHHILTFFMNLTT